MPADEDRCGVLGQLHVEHGHLETADERQDGRLLVEAAARQPQVGRIGWKFVQRRIHREPHAPVRSFVDVHLGPRMVVKRAADAANVCEADGDARGNSNRACHGDIERRVLVAVANLGSQHFERGGKTDGWLLVEERVDVARQLLGARTRPLRAGDGLLRFGADFGRVAFDERFRLQVLVDVAIRWTGLQCLRIRQLDRRAAHGLTRALKIRVRQVRAIELEPQQAHVARLVDALTHRRNNGRSLEQVRLHPPRHGKRLRAIRRLANGDQAERAFLSYDIARVGNPRRRPEPLVFHLDAERGDRTLAGVPHDFAIADVHGDRSVPQRRRIEDGPLLLGTCGETTAGEQPRKILGENGRLRELACFASCAAAGYDRDDETRAGACIGNRLDVAAHHDGARARIERELEGAQREVRIDARGGV